MKLSPFALVAALLGVTGSAAAASSSTLGILKANGVSLDDWETAYTKASTFDGDQGPQNDFYVSAFSLLSALAMTWDRDAIYAQAKAVGDEFYGKGVQVVAGPTSQPLGRTPWGGRNVEGFGPDPYLNGIATGLETRAYVDAGIIPGAKHFLLNEQETNRTGGMGGGGGGGLPEDGISNRTESGPGGAVPSGGAIICAYSSNADDKTVHETYLWPFYDAVRNGLSAVMCAMTKVNGSMSCESSALLMKNLKTELGFPGMVWPDMNGQSTAQGSALGGDDYGSSSIWSTSTMQALLSNGTLSQARLDDMAIRNVIAYYYVGLDDGAQPAAQATNAYVDVRANHSALIRANSAKSLALLKNTHGALPLHKPRASLPYVVDSHMALTMRAAPQGTMLRWIMNDTYSSSGGSTLIVSDASSTSAQVTYENYASNSDVCLVFLNALSGEGADRTELYNADQDAMVNTVADNCNNTVVVINAVGPRLVDAWIEHDNVTALLYGSVLGQESGNSIVDVLYGDVNPSGRLTYTIAKNESDYNVDLCYTAQCNFTEGVYLDYRHFDAADITPRFPFGHGLSYTSFAYTHLSTAITNPIPRKPVGLASVGGPKDLWSTIGSISARITNTGSVSDAEIPQLYIGFPEVAAQPVRQLRGFERVELDKGEGSTVEFELRRRDVSYWSVEEQAWVVASGEYKVFVGASSRDLRLEGSFVV
ncbi:glycoside hydrolase family 3 protein [Aspergillus heterothallicus]